MDKFWDMLDPAERDALAEVAQPITYKSDRRIFREGEPSEFALVLRSGWVKVAGLAEDGETVLALRRSGDLVGESASADRPRRATVVALGEVHALTISAHRFAGLLRDRPAAATALARTHWDRQAESDRKRMDVRNSNSDKRLARLFLELAEGAVETADGIVLDIPLTQAEFGQLICARTGIVERTLHNWRERGIVSTMPRRHVIHDLARLSAIARNGGPPGGASSPHDG
ncbi:Crp/Fnr family transcriptional regulator [Actinomadura sp. DC4]|uniref:Crp/Fnr family transcriptional regulator n=1 Tax=Actinomadura sp. DC4 TaxID=3055069 RepID=UPI0025B257D6|nr:Crp/Fnr family transcriptional regulator [Actinomadura sp. DC4]MDN3351165.1 Crp/Fnr family transcriptional regulator [Actinomadura sp. DC4]